MEARQEMEKDDLSFLSEINKLIYFIEAKLPEEIIQDVEARVLLNTLKGIMEDKRTDILLQYSNYNDALKDFAADCEDSLYTEDIRIVNDARQLGKSCDNLVSKYTQTVGISIIYIEKLLDVWSAHERSKRIAESEIQDQKEEEAVKEIERMGGMPVQDVGINPFDTVLEK